MLFPPINLNFSSLFKKVEHPGYVPEVTIEAARRDLIFGSTDQPLPDKISYLDQFPTRHLQLDTPRCVSYGVTHFREWFDQKHGHFDPLSPDYLAESSLTRINGNSVQQVLDTAKKVGIAFASDYRSDASSYDQSRVPYPVPTLGAEATGRALDHRETGYTFLRPYIINDLKSALQTAPIGITIGIEGLTFGYRKEGSVLPMPTRPFQDYHCVVCCGYNQNGWQVYDSLRVAWYYLAWDYVIDSAFTMQENLPLNWQQTQQQAQDALLQNNANRYGKVRNYPAEVQFASIFLSSLQRLNNKSVLDCAGRDWAMLIRAGVYGNYSITDLVNSLYYFRRNKGIYPFNFDVVRK